MTAPNHADMIDPTTIKTKWDLRPLLDGDDDVTIEAKRQAVRQAADQFIKKWQLTSDYLTTKTTLVEALAEYNNWLRDFGSSGTFGYYYHLRSQIEQNNPTVITKLNQSEQFAREIWNDMQFFTLNLGRIDAKQQQEFLKAPELKFYNSFLRQLFAEAVYTLSDAEEKIINLHQSSAHDQWVRLLTRLINSETRDQRNLSELIGRLDDPNALIRDEAAMAIDDIFEKHLPVAEAELNAVLETKRISDRLRGAKRPDEIRHVTDDFPTAAADALIQSVTTEFGLAHRYYALKAKLLGRTRLAYHERNLPVGALGGAYSYHRAVEIVESVLNRLDPELASHFINFVTNGQIDVYPALGKNSGAFCAYELITQPVYIMLNYTDRLQDVLTLAHEVGHGLNDELIRKNQPAIYFGTSIATAEVASTFVEDFVFDVIAKQATPKERLTILMMQLNEDIATIFRQVAFYNFERELHDEYRRESYLSAARIGGLFRKHVEAYLGDAIEFRASAENWWIYVSHFRSFFYVYSYASGLLISKYLQASVRRDPAQIAMVKSFLATGRSRSPADTFRRFGVSIEDPKFWQAGLDSIARRLEEAEALSIGSS